MKHVHSTQVSVVTVKTFHVLAFNVVIITIVKIYTFIAILWTFLNSTTDTQS